jgi:hypothetical protein
MQFATRTGNPASLSASPKLEGPVAVLFDKTQEDICHDRAVYQTQGAKHATPNSLMYQRYEALAGALEYLRACGALWPRFFKAPRIRV